MQTHRSSPRNCALTLLEVLVVVFMLMLLGSILLPKLAGSHRSLRVNCVNNLKQVGLAYRIWAGENNGKYPMEVSVTNGGAMELAGRDTWLNYLVMSNELNTPKLLLCPCDAGRPPAATSFSGQLKYKISYFIGLDATESHPPALLSGDDNFAIGSVPVKSGLLRLTSDMPLAWTTARHHFIGNIGFADGSVQIWNNSALTNWLHQTSPAINRLAMP